MRWYTFATHVSLAALFILGSGQALGQYRMACSEVVSPFANAL